jgi:hypothetical protein
MGKEYMAKQVIYGTDSRAAILRGEGMRMNIIERTINDVTIPDLNRSVQPWDAFSPRRNEENEGSEETAINWLSSRPSLSSLLRGEKPLSQSPLV